MVKLEASLVCYVARYKPKLEGVVNLWRGYDFLKTYQTKFI